MAAQTQGFRKGDEVKSNMVSALAAYATVKGLVESFTNKCPG